MTGTNDTPLPQAMKEAAMRAKALRDHAETTHANAHLMHKRAHALDERAKQSANEEIDDEMARIDVKSSEMGS